MGTFLTGAALAAIVTGLGGCACVGFSSIAIVVSLCYPLELRVHVVERLYRSN